MFHARMIAGTFSGRLRDLLVVLISWLALSAGQLGAQSLPGVIKGQIRDTGGGAPLEGVAVRVMAGAPSFRFDRTVTTDAQGRYSVFDVPAGSPYVIVARRIGFAQAKRDSLAVRSGDTLVVDLVLTPVAKELPEVKVKARGSIFTAPMISKAELEKQKTMDPFAALYLMRPGLLLLICGSTDYNGCRLDLCLLSHKAPGFHIDDPRFEPDVLDRCAEYVAAAGAATGASASKWYAAVVYSLRKYRRPSDVGQQPDSNDPSLRGRPDTVLVGRIFKFALGTNGCPMVDRVVIDGRRVDFPGVPIFQTLERIAMETVDSIALVDCWNYDHPEALRNAIWIYGATVLPEHVAYRWLTFSLGGIMQLEPLAEVDNRKIALGRIAMLSVGYQTRLGRRLTGRFSIGHSFLATRYVAPIEPCAACGGSEYDGGSFQVAQAELSSEFVGGVGLGLGLGIRRYALPSGASDRCVECQDASLRSQIAPFLQPVLRLTAGHGMITTIEIGPLFSSFRGKLMTDLSISLTRGFPLRGGGGIRKQDGAAQALR